MNIGFHIPFSGSLKSLQKRIILTRGNSFQIFARGLRGGKIPILKEKDLNVYRQFLEEKKITQVIVHAPYIYNLAVTPTEDVQFLLEDLALAEKLKANYFVLQPGYHKKEHPIVALENIKENLKQVIAQSEWSGQILIKNMAGAGTEMPANLQDWNELISFHACVGGALDFARLYASGTSFVTKSETVEVCRLIEETIGWEKIKLLYINDSGRSCGLKKNAYAPLGEGLIGFSGYQHMLQDKALQEKVWIVENQPTYDHYDQSLAYLTDFFKRGEQNDGNG